MTKFSRIDAPTLGKIMSLLQTERRKALSLREWKHRLAGYGYAIKHTDSGDVVTTLPHGLEICSLPAGMSA